jgi:hypothetical protein
MSRIWTRQGVAEVGATDVLGRGEREKWIARPKPVIVWTTVQ